MILKPVLRLGGRLTPLASAVSLQPNLSLDWVEKYHPPAAAASQFVYRRSQASGPRLTRAARDPEGSRLHLGALLLGYYTDDGKLIDACGVGRGMPDKVLGDLRRRLKALQSET